MKRLIQDIQPELPAAPVAPPHSVQRRIKDIHHATNVPRLAHLAHQRMTSFDIIAPGQLSGRQRSPVLPRHRPVAPVKPRATAQLPTRTSHRRPAPTPVATPPEPVTAPTVQHSSLLRRMADFAQYPLIAAIALGAAYSSTVGQTFVLVFALACLGLRLSSRYSFGAAILLLVAVPFFTLLHQTGVAQNAAIYAYELLVAGTVLAIVELWRDQHRKKQNKTQHLLHKKA